jgi:hypothetical protein
MPAIILVHGIAREQYSADTIPNRIAPHREPCR